MKIARWITTKKHGIEPTTAYTLRVGAKGRGKRLSPTIECWTDSHKSMELADQLCAAHEAAARADGYTILVEEEDAS